MRRYDIRAACAGRWSYCIVWAHYVKASKGAHAHVTGAANSRNRLPVAVSPSLFYGALRPTVPERAATALATTVHERGAPNG